MLFGPVLYVMGLVAGAIQRVKSLFRAVCVHPKCERGKPHHH